MTVTHNYFQRNVSPCDSATMARKVVSPSAAYVSGSHAGIALASRIVGLLATLLLAFGIALPQVAAQDVTEKAIADSAKSLEAGLSVWITPDAFGADVNAINQQIAAYPDLDLRILVVGNEAKHANLEKIATSTVNRFGGTAIVFSPSNAYMFSGVATQAQVDATISRVGQRVAAETNVAVAIGIICEDLSQSIAGNVTTADSTGQSGSSLTVGTIVLIAVGIVAVVGAFIMILMSQKRKAQLAADKQAGSQPFGGGGSLTFASAEQKERYLETMIQDATALREQIAASIIDINEMLVLNQDAKIQQRFETMVVEYERYSSQIASINPTTSAPETADYLVDNLQRIQKELQTIMTEVL